MQPIFSERAGVVILPPALSFAELGAHIERLSKNGIWTAIGGHAQLSQGETVRVVATGLTGLSTATFIITAPSGAVSTQQAGSDPNGTAFVQVSAGEVGAYSVQVVGRGTSFLESLPFIGMVLAPESASVQFSAISGTVQPLMAVPAIPRVTEQIGQAIGDVLGGVGQGVGAAVGSLGKGAGEAVGGALSGLTPTLLVAAGLLAIVAFSPAGKEAAVAAGRRL